MAFEDAGFPVSRARKRTADELSDRSFPNKRKVIAPTRDDGESEDDDEEASETEDERDEEEPKPPQCIVRAARAARELDKNFCFNVVAFWGDNGKGRAEFKVQCSDCPDTFYETKWKVDTLGTTLKQHVQEKRHRANVDARLASRTISALTSTITA